MGVGRLPSTSFSARSPAIFLKDKPQPPEPDGIPLPPPSDLAPDLVPPPNLQPPPVPTPVAEATKPPQGWAEVKPDLWGPEKKADIRIEGGSTLRTFQMPPHADRVQYIITSPSTRPIKAKVELWIGPIRCVHELVYDCMNGLTFPLRATLQFKKVRPVLKISTDSTYEFPLECGVYVPSAAESEKIQETTTEMFYTAPLKDRVQGGSTIDNKGGAIRSFRIDPTWEKTQVMIWSKDVGKKSFKSNIEILQGPNNAKQFLKLRCGGSTQPYHFVIDTPGPDWTIRCNSKKYLEDGLFEIAVAPFGELGEYKPEDDVVIGGGGF
mmetsp:Transcript_27161/g.33778  ORF Transcript_27161/g.33778 Transcript_27161/m.33778 type:complete len:323 (-) Transcript_27161:397-1365(-)